MPKSLTAPSLRARKVRDGHDPLVMVTAYDAPAARMAARGRRRPASSSATRVAMVVLGYDDTLQVTIDDMAHHTAAVARVRAAETCPPSSSATCPG